MANPLKKIPRGWAGDAIEVQTADLANLAITTGKLADDAVTNAKLADIARGSIKVGGAANAPTDLAAKDSGKILVGDGTDLLSVAVSGDATLASNGALTIAAGALAASAGGRAKMADSFFDVATVDLKFATGSIGEDRLTANELTGRAVGNVAGGNLIGGIPVVFFQYIPDGVTGDIDTVLTHKVLIYDVVVIKVEAAGAAGNTIQVKSGANAITNAIDTNIADAAVARVATIDDVYHEIAAAGTLRVTRTKAGGNAAVYLMISAIRRA